MALVGEEMAKSSVKGAVGLLFGTTVYHGTCFLTWEIVVCGVTVWVQHTQASQAIPNSYRICCCIIKNI